VEIVKVSTQTPQMPVERNGSIPKAVRAQAMSGESGAAGEADPRVGAQSPTPVDAQKLQQTADELAAHFNLKMEVVWDDSAGRQVLKVMSQDGKRVLLQFPAEEALKMAERLRSGSGEGLLTSTV
jgi:uncharacterized FlaG/YvyC family protein